MINSSPAASASTVPLAPKSLLMPGEPLTLPNVLKIAERTDLEWEFFRDRVERCWLYRATAEGPAAVLIRFQPGGRVPLHEHTGYEHILVLSGAQQDENGSAEAGTLVVNPPGTRHSVVSKDGCTVLVIYEKPVKFIEPL